MTPVTTMLYRFHRAKTDRPWWTVEDRGGFPPFWSAACGTPPLQREAVSEGTPRPDGSVLPWPSEWDRRPHP